MVRSPVSAGNISLEPLDLVDLDRGDQLLQTGFWGEFKAAAGWKARAFGWTAGGDFEGIVGRFLVLERSFPGGLKMAYVPYGPALPEIGTTGLPLMESEAGVLIAAIAGELRNRLSRGCFVIRFDLCGGTFSALPGNSPAPAPLPPPMRRAPYRVQPPDTVILLLKDRSGTSCSEDDLLAGMHKKTRYNIRLAVRKGVEVVRLAGDDALDALPAWYRIYEETGRRDGIALHPESYYRRLISMAAGNGSSGDAPGMSLYIARHEGDDLAGIVVSHSGSRATYMYGASSALKRELMPNHLLQWTAIRDALAEGAGEYDFFGIPPADDPSHPMHGLWRFKTGFGGNLHHYYGAWDFAFSPFFYRLYAAAEKIRGRMAARRKRR